MISFGSKGNWALGRNNDKEYFGFVGEKNFENEKVISYSSLYYGTIMNTFTNDSPTLLYGFGYNSNWQKILFIIINFFIFILIFNLFLFIIYYFF